MNILFIILLVILILVSIVSFAISIYMDNKAKANKDLWFKNHTDKENELITSYIEFVRKNKIVKTKKVNKNEKKD